MGFTQGRLGMLLVFGIGFGVACSDDAPPNTPTPTDTGIDTERDAGVDAGFADGGLATDAGPPPDAGILFSESSCVDCTAGCGAGSCLTNNLGESFCADRCSEDTEGCIDGFACVDISGGQSQFFCIPPQASCTVDGLGLGTSCIGGAGACTPGYDQCEGDFHALGYCTRSCAGPEDCPRGYTCGPGDDGSNVCLADRLSGPETCARHGNPAEVPCAVDIDCIDIAATVCVRSEPTLPGVCARQCSGPQDCDDGQICGMTDRGPVCLSAACQCHANPVADGTRNLMDEALSAIGLSRCGLIFDIHEWAPNPLDLRFDPFRLSFYDPLHHAPLDGLAFGKSVVADLDAADAAAKPPVARARAMVERMAQVLDAPAVRRPPLAPDASAPLVEAMVAFIEVRGAVADRAALTADAQTVPMDLQLALATVLDGLRRATIAQDRALLSSRNRRDLYDFGPSFIAPRADGLGLNVELASVQTLLLETFRYEEIYGGAADVLDAIATADLGRFAIEPTQTGSAATNFLFLQDTPFGRVGIGDGESGIYRSDAPGLDGPWALLVDLGGHDHFYVSASGNQSADHPVSVLIDLGGEDTYGYLEVPDVNDTGNRLPSDEGGRYQPRAGPDEDNGPISLSNTPRQGAGRMGIGVLVDLGTDNDHYQSLRMSQGTGIFGAGILVDEGGDDTYLAEAAAQGAGVFGLGLLYDVNGDDVRRAYTASQGFGYAMGAGAVYDAAGNDQYLMDPGDPDIGGDPLYFNAQRAGRANSTLGQGFGFGRRADFTDRVFMSGGIGLLIDGAGADRYEGSVFAQGGGFWFGTGILADHEGDDTYDALWYGVATGAHYALAMVLDNGGNDVYGGALPRINVTLGGAHDYTASFLVDERGNDIYYGSRITLGSGNLNGMGVFVDNAGDDQYYPRTLYGIGNAGLLESDEPGAPRRRVDTVGVFIDANGTDTYLLDEMDPLAAPGNDKAWLQSQNDDPAVQLSELGTGIDGTGDSTVHARD